MIRFPGRVFAHNGGRFDLPGYIWRYARELLHGQPVFMIGSRIVEMRIGAASVRDSFAILPAPLREHDKGSIEYAKFHHKVRNRHRVEILRYLRRDCASLLELVLRFIEENGLRHLTAASAAMASIRELCEPVERMDEGQDALARAFYFGGRVEAKIPGDHTGSFRILDIRSAYPDAMREMHPASAELAIVVRPKKILPQDLVVCVGNAKGCFPLRTDKGLSFPHGSHEFRVTGWEYLAAKELGLLGRHTVPMVLRSEKLVSFAPYVDFHYAGKEEAEAKGDKAGRLIKKIYLNSGYGKFCQRPDRFRDYIVQDADEAIPPGSGWEEDYVDEKAGFAVWSKKANRPGGYYNVATGASITGCVRAKLMRAMHGRKVYYCDTDSIILPASEKFATGSGLGSWGVEAEGDRLVIAGKKLYGFRKKDGTWKIASKGVRLDEDELIRIARGETVEYVNPVPTFSIRSEIRFTRRKIRATSILPAASRGGKNNKNKPVL